MDKNEKYLKSIDSTLKDILKELKKSNRQEVPKEKFVVKFDEAPALLFVSSDGKDKERIFINGVEVVGWVKADIHSAIGEVTTHEISYITGCVKGKEGESYNFT